MKLFRHHIALPAILLAALDGLLFVTALYVFGFAGSCESCVFRAVARLEFHEAVLLTVAFSLITTSVGLYNRDALLDFRLYVSRFLLASQLVLIPSVATVGFLRAASDMPFGWFVGILTLAIALFFAVIFVVRLLVRWVLASDVLKRRILVLGSGPLADAVKDYIANEGATHLVCIGQVGSERPRELPVAVGNVLVQPHAAPARRAHSLALIAISKRADEVVIAGEDRRGLPMDDLLECRLQGLQVSDYAVFWEREVGRIDLRRVGPGALAVADGFRVDFGRRAVKRMVDVAVGLVALTLLLPVLLVAAIAIKLDSRGPVFYWQERVGLNGRPFDIWKLRSMREDAERDGVPRYASASDDRTTRVGRFIRRTRIDEIPQIVNVLLGDMSFIGPRPERPFFVERLRQQIPYYDLRHRVRPGITGWAQVNHHYTDSVEDTEIKVSYDLYYVKNNDTLLDLAILGQTVRVVFFGYGAR